MSVAEEVAVLTTEREEIPGQLTRFPVGTMRELWALAYPIMGSLLSVGIMILANRIFLARYAVDAFNAVSEAVMCFMAIEFTMYTLAAVSEVLVGRAFGAVKYDQVSKPVWTAIWLSLASFIIFIPLAVFGVDFIFAGSSNKAYAKLYFSTLSYFGPLFPLNAALASFWIGRGKTGFITSLVAIASLLNVALDPLLIFGIGPFPELGVQGAALARGISQLILCGALFCAFLSRYNRQFFKTSNYHIDLHSLKQIFSYGSSQAISMLGQCAAWAVFARIMSQTSQEHMLASGISDTIYFFFNFAIEGVSKAASSVVSNLVGAARQSEIIRVTYSGVRTLFVLGCALFVLMFSMPDFIISLFVSPELASASTLHMLKMSLFWIWCTLMGEALLFFWSGILMAFGDTRYTLVTSSIFVWVLGILPAYFIVSHWKLPAHYALAAACFYYLCTGIAYQYRVRRKFKEL